MFQNYPKFSEFEEDEYLKGEKVNIDDILNKEVLITKFKKEPSKVNKGTTYNKIQIIDRLDENQNPHYVIFFSGSQILDKQLTKYKDRMPFCATFIKEKNYYTLV